MADTRSGVEITQLVAEHHQVVYRYAYRLTGSVQDAEDLTQQVFLTAQQKLGQLRNINAAKSWLFAILRNSFVKDRQRRRPVLATDVAMDVDSVPTDSLEGDVDQERLQDALNRLPDDFRRVVLMFYFEECSYKEIAERLEMPIGTVMSRLSRAKGHLRSILLEPEQNASERPDMATEQR